MRTKGQSAGRKPARAAKASMPIRHGMTPKSELRAEAWFKEISGLIAEIAPSLERGKARLAFEKMMCVIAGNASGNAERVDKLEDRLAILEAVEAKRRNVEITNVIKHDKNGRISSFEKRLEIREDP